MALPILIAVARVRNEEDIVEAFVRHHLALVDRLILLDNGSNDSTREILQSLKAEGLPLTLFASNSATFVEATHNTYLARQAAALGADWILCLDCDEFVDQRRIPGGLRDYLAAKPADVRHLHAGLLNYNGTEVDDRDEPIVPLRLRYRDAQFCALKVIVRARLLTQGGTLEHGNHDVDVDGARLPQRRDDNLVLAHYPIRSGWQMLSKAVVGRLKVLASGVAEAERGTAGHYTELLANLRTHPEWLLFDRSFIDGQRQIDDASIDDPIDYAGGPLRYTAPTDHRLRAARSILASAEELARRHGALLDTLADAREQTRAWDTEITQVF